MIRFVLIRIAKRILDALPVILLIVIVLILTIKTKFFSQFENNLYAEFTSIFVQSIVLASLIDFYIKVRTFVVNFEKKDTIALRSIGYLDRLCNNLSELLAVDLVIEIRSRKIASFVDIDNWITKGVPPKIEVLKVIISELEFLESSPEKLIRFRDQLNQIIKEIDFFAKDYHESNKIHKIKQGFLDLEFTFHVGYFSSSGFYNAVKALDKENKLPEDLILFSKHVLLVDIEKIDKMYALFKKDVHNIHIRQYKANN